MLALNAFNLSPEKFNKLFPFHLLLDDRNCIVSFGESLRKISAVEEGRPFSDFFHLKCPTLYGSEFHTGMLVDQIVMLEPHHSPGLILRGQVELVGNGQAIFVGTPWFANMDQVVAADLSIRDFAVHDPMIDLLHVLQTQEATTREAKELLMQVNHQKNALKESEERISSMVLNLQTGILHVDETGKVVLCNKMFCDLFRISEAPEALRGTDFLWVATRSKRLFANPASFVQRMQDLHYYKRPMLSELLELADGRIVERDYMPIFVASKYRGHLWKYTDITDRVHYHRKLRKQEEKYRGIIENMKLGILETGLDDRIQFVNSNFCELSGYSAEELIGRKAADVLQVSSTDQAIDERHALRSREVSDCYELEVKNKRGESCWWFVSVTPNYNDMGELVGAIGIHLDITRQKTMQDELRVAKDRAEESSRAKESFLANMSHEIRTPLNAVIGMIRELNRLELKGAGGVYLKHAGSASQHLLSIVNNILDISKIEAGEFQLESQTFNLVSVFGETEAIMSPAVHDKLLELKFLFSPDVNETFVGDPHRIRQILLNIIGNAVKFTERGTITVQCRTLASYADRGDVCISISDTGIGMDENYLNSLFKKFTQEDLSIARKHGGTGLGMAITYELIQLMGGRIEVYSEKNKGTRFDVFLTLFKGDASMLAPADPMSDENILQHAKVLLVEDNQLNRLVVCNTLQYYGVEVTEAEDGLKAVDLLRDHVYDVILMDLQMPGMDGLEATRIIRTILRLDIPIVALTANAFRKDIEKCMQVGMNDYVTKPFEEKALVDTVLKHVIRRGTFFEPEVSEPSVATERLYDLVDIKAMSRGNEEFIGKMITTFCATVQAALGHLVAAARNRDYKTVKETAHKMKPSVATFCVTCIKEDILWLERLDIVTCSPDEVLRVVDKVAQILQAVIKDLTGITPQEKVPGSKVPL
jgi:two-component system, sensor histidine kinase